MPINTTTPTTLDALYEILTTTTDHGLDWTDLPVFGGEEPRDTSGIWSWDQTRLLVGTCAGDLRIVDRDER